MPLDRSCYAMGQYLRYVSDEELVAELRNRGIAGYAYTKEEKLELLKRAHKSGNNAILIIDGGTITFDNSSLPWIISMLEESEGGNKDDSNQL